MRCFFGSKLLSVLFLSANLLCKSVNSFSSASFCSCSGLTSNSVSSSLLTSKSDTVVSSTTENVIAIFTVVVADPPSIIIDSVTEDASSYLDVDWIFSVQVGSTPDNSTSSFTLDLFEPYVASNIYIVEKIDRLFSVSALDRSFTVNEQTREFTV